MSTSTRSTNLSTTTRHALYGVVGGVAGGIVFGILMQMMDMLGMVAELVGSSSVAVGWVVHLAISAFAGGVFGVLLGSFARSLVPAALVGMAYGIVWWVLGALLIMPAQLGMPVFEFGTTAWQSLLGHLMFGIVLGLAFVSLVRRAHD